MLIKTEISINRDTRSVRLSFRVQTSMRINSRPIMISPLFFDAQMRNVCYQFDKCDGIEQKELKNVQL